MFSGQHGQDIATNVAGHAGAVRCELCTSRDRLREVPAECITHINTFVILVAALCLMRIVEPLTSLPGDQGWNRST